MKIDLLYDLKLSGVKWELLNSILSKDFQQEKQVVEQIKIEDTNTIAPIAPISILSAKEIVYKVNNFSELCKEINNFNHPLKMFAKNTILPTIGENVLVLTDPPSSEDDESGQILSGTAGELFEKMLNAIGTNRNLISICPLMFWRTPGNRTPTEEELSLTVPFIDKFIELTIPKVILTLGVLAEKYQLKNNLNIKKFSIPSPNHMILKPDLKRFAWEQLQKLLKTLE